MTDPRTLHKNIDNDITTLAAVDLDELGRQLHAIVNATSGAHNLRHWEDPAGAEPDGYPPTASGADAGGGHTTSTSTSVERAVDARTRHRDPIARLVDRAIESLANAVDSTRSVAVILATIDKTRADAPPAGLAAGCWALNRVGGWEPVHATVIIDGQPYALGRWAYDYQRRLGTLPTLAHCRAHIEGRKVFVKA